MTWGCVWAVPECVWKLLQPQHCCPGAEHLSEEKLAVLGPPPVCTACIRHFKAALLLQAVTSAVAETNPLAGQPQRASLRYFRSPGLFFTLFWGTCAALAQGLHSFIPFLLFSFPPLPPTQHCQQLWGQACPCSRRFACSSAFSLTLPPSAVLRAELRPALHSHLLHWEQIILWSSDLPEMFGHDDTKQSSLC